MAVYSRLIISDNKPSGIRGIAIDLTGQKKAEEEKKQSKLVAEYKKKQKVKKNAKNSN